MKKQFIFLRFGMNNFTMDWFEWRLSWFENVSLVSLENNANDSMYVVIYINRNIPVIAKRRLNAIIERSAIRAYTYIIEIDFPNEVKPKSLDFVNTHCADNERVMITRLDMDDGYAKGFLEEIDTRDALEVDQEKTVLYSFAPGYRFAIEEKKAIEWDIHYRGLNMFLFTTDRSATIWEFSHFLGNEYATEKGWKIVEDYTLHHRWYRSETPDNTDVTVWNDKYTKLVSSIEAEDAPVIGFGEIVERFSLDEGKLTRFYREYPTIPYTSSILIYDSLLTKKCTLMRRDFNRLVDVYCESIPRNINEKPKTKWNIKRVQKEEDKNFLHAVESIYGLESLPDADGLSEITNISEQLKAINWNSYIVVFAAKGPSGLEVFNALLPDIMKKTSHRGLLGRLLSPKPCIDDACSAEGGGAIAIWDGKQFAVYKSAQRLYKEVVIDIPADKLCRIRATSCTLESDCTAQVFVGDSNTHTWNSEVDYAFNQSGLNVVLSPLSHAGRVVDSYLVKGVNGKITRKIK